MPDLGSGFGSATASPEGQPSGSGLGEQTTSSPSEVMMSGMGSDTNTTSTASPFTVPTSTTTATDLPILRPFLVNGSLIANGSNITFSPVSFGDEGYYVCVVTTPSEVCFSSSTQVTSNGIDYCTHIYHDSLLPVISVFILS